MRGLIPIVLLTACAPTFENPFDPENGDSGLVIVSATRSGFHHARITWQAPSHPAVKGFRVFVGEGDGTPAAPDARLTDTFIDADFGDAKGPVTFSIAAVDAGGGASRHSPPFVVTFEPVPSFSVGLDLAGIARARISWTELPEFVTDVEFREVKPSPDAWTRVPAAGGNAEFDTTESREEADVRSWELQPVDRFGVAGEARATEPRLVFTDLREPSTRRALVSPGTVDLDWDDVGGAAKYKVFSRVGSEGPFLERVTDVTESKDSVTGLVASSRYEWAYIAISATGGRSAMSLVSATPPVAFVQDRPGHPGRPADRFLPSHLEFDDNTETLWAVSEQDNNLRIFAADARQQSPAVVMMQAGVLAPLAPGFLRRDAAGQVSLVLPEYSAGGTMALRSATLPSPGVTLGTVTATPPDTGPTLVEHAMVAYDAGSDVAYVFGGSLPNGAQSGEMWRVAFNERSEASWTQVPGTPYTKSGAALAAFSDGKIYAFAGGENADGSGEDALLRVLDTRAAAPGWETVEGRGQPPAPRHFDARAIAWLPTGTHFTIVGGIAPSGGGLSDVWRFDLIRQVWSQLPDVPSAFGDGRYAAIELRDGTLFAWDGRDLFRLVNAEEAVWERLDVPSPRRGAAVAARVDQNDIYVVGGEAPSALVYDEFWTLSPDDDLRWRRPLAGLVNASKLTAAALAIGAAGRLYAFGGRSSLSECTGSELRRFELASRTWDALAQQGGPVGWCGRHALAYRRSGAVETLFLAGGNAAQGSRGEVYRLTIDTNIWSRIDGASAPNLATSELVPTQTIALKSPDEEGDSVSFVMVGLDDATSKKLAVWRFDSGAEAPAWTKLASTSAPVVQLLEGVAHSLADDALYVRLRAGDGKTELWRYDLPRATWARMTLPDVGPRTRDAPIFVALERPPTLILSQGSDENGAQNDLWRLPLQ